MASLLLLLPVRQGPRLAVASTARRPSPQGQDHQTANSRGLRFDRQRVHHLEIYIFQKFIYYIVVAEIFVKNQTRTDNRNESQGLGKGVLQAPSAGARAKDASRQEAHLGTDPAQERRGHCKANPSEHTEGIKPNNKKLKGEIALWRKRRCAEKRAEDTLQLAL